MFVPAFSPVVGVEPERSAESNPSNQPPTSKNQRWCAVAVRRSYEEELRVIGLTLEAKGISVFEITSLPERYLIQGERKKSGSSGKKFLGLLPLLSASDSCSFTLSLAEINKRCQVEIAKPSAPGQLDNFRRPANVLGTIGAYLDSKQASYLT